MPSSERQSVWVVKGLAVQESLTFDFNIMYIGRLAPQLANPRPSPYIPMLIRKYVSLSATPLQDVELEFIDPPCPEHDLGIEQLGFLVHLLAPAFVWIRPWEDRYALQNVPDAALEFTSVQLQRLLRYRQVLEPFTAARTCFRLARLYEGSDELWELGEISGESRPLREVSRDLSDWGAGAAVLLAADLFSSAHAEPALSNEFRLLALFMAAEALFNDSDKSELSYRLAHRLAVLNGTDANARKDIFDLVKRLYQLRSSLMHGSGFTRKGFVRASWEDVSALDALVRASLMYVIALGKWTFGETQVLNRDDYLKRLDRSMFDAQEIRSIRRVANEFWNRTDGSQRALEDETTSDPDYDEHLYAGHLWSGLGESK